MSIGKALMDVQLPDETSKALGERARDERGNLHAGRAVSRVSDRRWGANAYLRASAGQIAMDSSHVGHRGASHEQRAHAEPSPYGELIVVERAFQRRNRGLNRHPEMATLPAIPGHALAAAGNLQIVRVEGERPLRRGRRAACQARGV